MGDLLDLARQLVAHPGWRWLPGMLTADDYRVIGVDSDGWLLVCGSSEGDVVRWWDASLDWLPELTDPLTALGLLVIAREVWGDPRLHAEPWGDSDGWGAWAPKHSVALRGDGDTEVEALARAILAAPVRGGA